MILTKFNFLSAAAMLIALPACPTWAAQASAGIAPGTKVVDSQGAEIGTVLKVNGDTLTVGTDKFQAAIPRTGFNQVEGRLVVNMTRQQLNDAVETGLAAARAKLAPGLAVSGSKGSPVGSIDSIDDQFATLKLLSGKLIRLPLASIGIGPNGGILGLTAQDLDALVAQSGPS